MSQYRTLRLAKLRSSQNTDGGWGYLAGRKSWLEPTCYAMLAMRGDPESISAIEQAWGLLQKWQRADGGWRVSAQVDTSGWATALCVTLCCVYSRFGAGFGRGVEWLVGTRGVEGDWFERVVSFFRPLPIEYDRSVKGWPWLADTTSWVEPTAHALVALKKAAQKSQNRTLRARIDEGERMLADRRSKDGGWNYGNRRVLREDLPSYAETTGLALLGLQGTHYVDIKAALDVAEKYWKRSHSPLARAWLAISLRNYDRRLPEPHPSPPPDDLMLAALEALAFPSGGHQWLKV